MGNVSQRIGVGETELGASLGFDRAAMRKRRNHLDKHDWWKDGAKIMWSEEAATLLRASVDGEDIPDKDEVDDAFDPFTATVCRLPKNAFFVEVAIDGLCEPVRLKKRGTGAKMMKKPIQVIRRADGTLQQV